MRNAEFDKETVLRSAMACFIEHGYVKTSMQKLTLSTGLHPGSIYCAFGNKRGLLLAAIGQYHLDRTAQFLAFFANDAAVMVNLRQYLNTIVTECLSCDGTKACLLTRTLSEILGHDPEVCDVLANHLMTYQQALTNQFALAQKRNEISTKRTPEQLARFFVMGIYGLRTYSQSHPDAVTLNQLADDLLLSVSNQ